VAPVHAQICLRAEGVSVLLDVAGGLPAIVHWGADLGEVSSDDFAALRLANILPVTSNLADEPNRLALLPEHWIGWLGRPGISGSR
jgi:alpha-galactosidase